MENKSINGFQNINSAMFNMLLEIVATQRVQSDVLCRLLSHTDGKDLTTRQEAFLNYVADERKGAYQELVNQFGSQAE
jgi:hypothetical protein